jgi:cytochrome c oxidase assembly protein subunit 15
MTLEQPALQRVRRLELSPAWFRRLSLASAISLYAIVISGAAVRLTGSGLGCDSWPGCESRSFFPQNDFHGAVEFGNRAVAIVPLSLSLLTWFAAGRTPGLGLWARRTAAGVALGTLAQAPLGLLTIKSDLHPLLVMSHFLLALVVLGGAVVVALEAWRLDRGAGRLELPTWLKRLALVLVAATAALVTSGAFATAAGPHPGDRADIRRLGDVDTMIAVHVRVTAAFGLALLLLVAVIARRRDEHPRLFRVTLGLLALVIVQMSVGELQYRLELPWGLVLVHVALAGAVWTSVVAYAAAIWRPPAWLTP